jgi:hypothetical protein
MPDARGTAIDVRAGISAIHPTNPETRVTFSSPFEADCTVAVTEWRNEPSDKVKLVTIYIKGVDRKGFLIGHQPFNKPGFDPPSFGWVASTIR